MLAPAAQAVLSAQQTVSPSNPPPVRGAGLAQAVPKLTVTAADISAETRQHYFSQEQFAVLQKLGTIFMPPMKGNPGALDAQAPDFLDFLISVSPAERQKLYRDGLDTLNAQAKQKFRKGFAELDANESAAILKPLLTVRLWVQDRPSDPMQNFVAQVHDDLRTATTNSRAWAEASAKAGRRFTRGSRTSGYYWLPIDPVDGE
jgi:hypothetical protein